MIKKLLKILLPILLLIGGVVVGFKTGFIEKTLSTVSVPFSIFKQENKLDVSREKVSLYSIPDTTTLKEDFDSITSVFNIEKKTKPVLKSEILGATDLQKLDEDFGGIYSLPNTYVGKANIVGFSVDKEGVRVLVNFAVYNDSTEISNHIYSVLKKDGVYTDLKAESTLIADAPMLELPSEYSFNKILEAYNLVDNLFKKDISSSFPILKEVAGEENSTIKSIRYIYQDQNINFVRVYGMPEKTVSYDISIPIDSIKVDKVKITK